MKIIKVAFLLITIFLFPAILYPAVTYSVSSLTIENQGILPNSGPTAILKLNITGTGGGTPVQYEEMTELTVIFQNLNANKPFNAKEHLKSVALYGDTNYIGSFDTNDPLIATATLSDNTATFTFSPYSLQGTKNFYIVIQTEEPDKICGIKGDGDQRMKFRASIYSFTYTMPYNSPPNPTSATVYPGIYTNTIICEADITDLVPHL